MSGDKRDLAPLAKWKSRTSQAAFEWSVIAFAASWLKQQADGGVGSSTFKSSSGFF
jgi:hypothetical protein